MKKAAYYILLFLPGFALCAYFISLEFFLKLMWREFFQTLDVLASTFELLMLSLPLLACFAGIVLLKLGQLLFLLWKRRWKSLKKWGVEAVLFILIPLVVVFLNYHLSDDRTMLTSLKTSFNKTDVNTHEILEWLDTLDVQEMEPKVRLFYDEADFPLNEDGDVPLSVKNTLLALRPDFVWLEVAKDNRPYLNLCYQSTALDVGVVIGTDFQAVTFPPDEIVTTIDIDQRVFVWME